MASSGLDQNFEIHSWHKDRPDSPGSTFVRVPHLGQFLKDPLNDDLFFLSLLELSFPSDISEIWLIKQLI